VEGEQLCILLLLDPSYCRWEDTPAITPPMQPSCHHIPDSVALQATISAFKESLKVTEYEVRCIDKTQENSAIPHN